MAHKAKHPPVKKMSALSITFWVIASTLISVALCLGLLWWIESLNNHNEAMSTGDAIVLFLIFAFVLGPTLIAAAIIGVILKKRGKN